MLITQTPANLNCSEFELLGFDSIKFAVPVTPHLETKRKTTNLRQLEVQTKASLSLIYLFFSVNCREVKTTSTRIDKKMNFFYFLLT